MSAKREALPGKEVRPSYAPVVIVLLLLALAVLGAAVTTPRANPSPGGRPRAARRVTRENREAVRFELLAVAGVAGILGAAGLYRWSGSSRRPPISQQPGDELRFLWRLTSSENELSAASEVGPDRERERSRQVPQQEQRNNSVEQQVAGRVEARLAQVTLLSLAEHPLKSPSSLRKTGDAGQWAPRHRHAVTSTRKQ